MRSWSSSSGVGRRQSLNYHTFNIKNNSQVELSGRPLGEVDKDPPPLCATWPGLDFNPRNVMAKAGQYATLSPCRITSWKHGYYIRMWQEWVREAGKGSGKWGRQSCCCCYCAHVGVAKRMLCVFWCWWWWLWQHDERRSPTPIEIFGFCMAAVCNMLAI